jgi:hypothetical protein
MDINNFTVASFFGLPTSSSSLQPPPKKKNSRMESPRTLSASEFDASKVVCTRLGHQTHRGGKTQYANFNYLGENNTSQPLQLLFPTSELTFINLNFDRPQLTFQLRDDELGLEEALLRSLDANMDKMDQTFGVDPPDNVKTPFYNTKFSAKIPAKFERFSFRYGTDGSKTVPDLTEQMLVKDILQMYEDYQLTVRPYIWCRRPENDVGVTFEILSMHYPQDLPPQEETAQNPDQYSMTWTPTNPPHSLTSTGEVIILLFYIRVMHMLMYNL